MATATALPLSKFVLHDRGAWSPRSDRTFFAVLLAIFWVGNLAGFGYDFPRYLHQTPPATLINHIHAVVFSVWILIFTAQVLLVTGDRVAWHRKLGWFAAGWAVLMLVLGPLAVLSTLAMRLHTPGVEPQFLAVNIVDVGGFVLMLAWGISLRKNPAAHKRVMLLALVAIADAGFSRALGFLPAPTNPVLWFVEYFYGNVLLIAVMAWWDWRKGRLLKQFVIGATALLSGLVAATWLNFWPPWKIIATGWIEAWARVMG